jgi:hypothetical protein
MWQIETYWTLVWQHTTGAVSAGTPGRWVWMERRRWVRGYPLPVTSCPM